MTERSEELRSVTLRYLAASDRGDIEAVLARFSQTTGTTSLGTAAGEYLRGPKMIAQYLEVEYAQFGRWPIPDPQVDAWVRGDVGWSIVRAEVGEEERHELRISLVFQLEHDDWKIVHEHLSMGQPVGSETWRPAGPLELLAEILSQEPPDISTTMAVDGTVTLVFTDIEGSTALNASFGDKAWLEVLRAHNQVVKSATLEHAGTVVKGIGDGFMLAFTSARTAMTASQAIQDRIAETFNDPGSPIRVRIGIHTGEAVREADDLFGHAVNYAARVAGAATGGEVLVSSLTHDLVIGTGEFAFEPPREAGLKGIEGAQVLYPLARLP